VERVEDAPTRQRARVAQDVVATDQERSLALGEDLFAADDAGGQLSALGTMHAFLLVARADPRFDPGISGPTVSVAARSRCGNDLSTHDGNRPKAGIAG